MQKKIKGVEETEAIRVYVNKDDRFTSGVMWRVHPPVSVKSEFDKEYPKGFWCAKEKELIEVISQITRWKLKSPKK